MDRRAVAAARAEFERAFQHSDQITAAKEFHEIEEPWTNFLVAAGRVFTKLEQGAKASARSKGWFDKKLHERRTDPLLRYVWHARNADEHTLQQITERNLGRADVLPASPEEEEGLRARLVESGERRPFALVGTVEWVLPHIVLKEVTDRGVQYSPPPLNNLSPGSVSLLVLAKLDAMLQEAEKLTNETQ